MPDMRIPGVHSIKVLKTSVHFTFLCNLCSFIIIKGEASATVKGIKKRAHTPVDLCASAEFSKSLLNISTQKNNVDESASQLVMC